MKLNDNERNVLRALYELSAVDGLYCVSFAPLIRATKLDRKAVRRACRSLKRKGVAEFYQALWTEDGQPAGAGYCMSRAGADMMKEAA